MKQSIKSFFVALIFTGIMGAGASLWPDKTGDTIHISMIAATSISDTLPQEALQGKTWKPESHAEYVKMHLYLDEPVKIRGIEIETCDGYLAANQYITPVVYLNFDEDYFHTKFDKNSKNIYRGEVDDFLKKRIEPARSVTINFNNSANMCLKSVRLLDPDNKPYTVIVPDAVNATVSATSTLAPQQAYDIMNLFDSRMENAWSSNGKLSGDEINFVFEKDMKISKLRIWNGYQRSDKHCFENSRSKTLEITGDKNYSASVSLKDIMGYQDVELPKAFNGKNLNIKIAEGYAGKTYKDLVISELRFSDGKKWFMPNPVKRLQSIAKANQDAFSKTPLRPALDKTLEKQMMGPDDNSVILRLRSDSSFFLEYNALKAAGGNNYKQSNYFALGNYEVKGGDGESIQLRLFGYLRKKMENVTVSWDCNGCGRDCNIQNQGGAAGSGNSEGIFQDFITIKKVGDHFTIENTGKTKRIEFEPNLQLMLR